MDSKITCLTLLLDEGIRDHRKLQWKQKLNYHKQHGGMEHSLTLLNFPHVENSCEINPSRMFFMIFNLAQCI